MIYKKCPVCSSFSVNRMRFAKSGNLHQWCIPCDKDISLVAIAKARKTRSQTRKPRRATQRAKKFHSVAFALVGWAIFAFSSVIATAYAQMAEPIEYVAVSATSTPIVNEIVKQEPEKPETLMEKIDRYADEANIPRWKLHALIKCESSYNPKAKNISSVESSHGLLQINLKAHNATIMEAQDPDFALAFAVKHWGERKSVWYNCSKKHSL